MIEKKPLYEIIEKKIKKNKLPYELVYEDLYWSLRDKNNKEVYGDQDINNINKHIKSDIKNKSKKNLI